MKSVQSYQKRHQNFCSDAFIADFEQILQLIPPSTLSKILLTGLLCRHQSNWYCSKSTIKTLNQCVKIIKIMLLNVNRINQAGFFQTYVHHSLPQWYPKNFYIIHLCTRHRQPYILNHVFDMNINFYDLNSLKLIYICREQISVFILEPVAWQFWLVSTPYLETPAPILHVLSTVD